MKSNLELMQNVVKPYIDAKNQALTNYDANMGVKNLFNNTATTGTSNGVTFTVKADKSVEAVGTLTSNDGIKVLATFHGEAGKQYLLTGGISSTKYLEVYNVSAGIDVKDTGNGVTFTPQSDTDFDVAAIVSGNGSTFNDTFYPMIREASITDPTYQPYAKTNVELTQDVADATITCEAGANVTSLRANVIKQGNLVIGNFFFEGACTSSDAILTVPAGNRPANGQHVQGIITVGGNIDYGYYRLDADGRLRQTSTSSAASAGSGSFAYYIGQL